LRRQWRQPLDGLLGDELAFLELDVDDEVLGSRLAQEDLEPLKRVFGRIELVGERPEEALAGFPEEAFLVEDGQDLVEGVAAEEEGTAFLVGELGEDLALVDERLVLPERVRAAPGFFREPILLERGARDKPGLARFSGVSASAGPPAPAAGTNRARTSSPSTILRSSLKSPSFGLIL
jgi:hypothetical protein